MKKNKQTENIKKWEESGLLDGLTEMDKVHPMINVIESNKKQVINELPDVKPMNEPVEPDYSIYPKPFRKLWERWYNQYLENRTLCLDCPNLMTPEEFEKYADDCYFKFCMYMYNSKQSGLIKKDFMSEVFKNQEFSDKWMKI